MFTGIITNIGIVNEISKKGNAALIKIKTREPLKEIKLGDSIAINGVCLTVVKKKENIFEVEAVEETLKKTTFKFLKKGEEVNLELPLKVNGRFDGHIVQGHVDCVGIIKSIKNLKLSWIFQIQIPDEFVPNVVKIGSIAVDGISLTIADVKENIIEISVIPYTMNNTILKNKNAGSRVNVEFDIIGKYISKYISVLLDKKFDEKLTIKKLKELGF